MTNKQTRAAGWTRPTSLLLAAALSVGPMTGCCKGSPPPPVDDTSGMRAPNDSQPASTGFSTGTKVVALAGAAALYYLYKHHQTAAAKDGPESQYYLSKNGRVYYRDAEHRAHWVTPPANGIQVPASEASEYQGFQGYNNSPTGRDLTGLGADADGT